MSKFGEIKKEIALQYLEEDFNRPWIVAYSGGKDSSLLLQLVWEALLDIPGNYSEKFMGYTRKVYVICNNTLVENPTVLKYVSKQLRLIQKSSAELGLPFFVKHTTPKLEDTFWTNLIGKGYPAPNTKFRWCTERLKIKPTSNYILDTISEHGEAIILIGTRSSESANRAASIKKYTIKGTRLREHTLPNAWAFAPIKDLETNDVWTYLAQVKCPWGGDNKKLIGIYKQATNNEDCPLVVDIKTPSCGNSRFGCWTCTVVKRDKSLEAQIDNGEDWLIPLIQLRDFMHNTINRDAADYDPNKWRMPIRRNNAEGLGPYWPKVRAYILKELLKAQKIIGDYEPDFQLISNQELVAIQVLWHRDFIFDQSVPDIYKEVYGEDLYMPKNNESIRIEKELLKESCGSDEDFGLINNLLKAQRNKILLVKKQGLQNDIEELLGEHLNPIKTRHYDEHQEDSFN